MNELTTTEDSTAIATIPEKDASIQPVGDNLEVIASTPTGMAECQVSLIDWMKNKIAYVKTEISTAQAEALELKTSYEYAVKQKWKKDTLLKHYELAEKRVKFQFARLDYYHKLLTALENGYYIVPPLGMELFAIRTDKTNPLKKWQILQYSRQGNFEQQSQILPEGVGEYRNPQPEVTRRYEYESKDEKTGITRKPFEATAWNDIEFPLNMVKPRIMEATSRAMALKVFDEMGVLPQDYKRNPDPVILGRIYQPKPTYATASWNRPKCITFMIAWHLNTKDL